MVDGGKSKCTKRQEKEKVNFTLDELLLSYLETLFDPLLPKLFKELFIQSFSLPS